MKLRGIMGRRYIAKKLCPQLVIVPTRFDAYREASRKVQTIFAEYDPHFRAMSLDEAYLDITEYLARDDVVATLQDRSTLSNTETPTHAHNAATPAPTRINTNIALAHTPRLTNLEAHHVVAPTTSCETSSTRGTSCTAAPTTQPNAGATIPPSAPTTQPNAGAEHRPALSTTRAEIVVEEIRQRIFDTTQLTASAGKAKYII